MINFVDQILPDTDDQILPGTVEQILPSTVEQALHNLTEHKSDLFECHAAYKNTPERTRTVKIALF